MELRNRIKMPAITLGYGTDDEVSERLKAFYAERAKGGVGLIGIALSATRLYRNPMIGLYDDRFIPGLKELMDVCQDSGVDMRVYDVDEDLIKEDEHWQKMMAAAKQGGIPSMVVYGTNKKGRVMEIPSLEKAKEVVKGIE